ncbi:hypothetical protein [Sphingomonas hengshuiensis]|uniref:Uncharacterized protein n=1 Tax=Sphingomonas hengshuiensis TaxID=1609977 RepID=A0A7U4LG36_9SPHN|nr:hypothetical protein [Sphingomonas hengshuiensis]AJP73152.1 hypothetical protein TS85_17170 [Sphingomonas hengshuiensis]
MSIWPRIVAGIAGTALIWAAADRFRQAALVKALRHDAAACVMASKTPGSVLDSCAPDIVLRVRQAWAAQQCEAAIKASDLYAIRAVCGEQVKRGQAALDAAQANLADAREQIARIRQDSDAALARAELRATDQADRKAHDDRTIDAAPRLDDGRVLCDAGCLRALGGEPAAAQP